MTSAPKPLPPVVDPLADLRAALPAELAPWVDRFGPGFLAMTRDELRSWITLANTGQSYEAYREIAQALPDTQLLSEWDRTLASWSALNDQNAQRLAENKAAIDAAVAILLKIGIAALIQL